MSREWVAKWSSQHAELDDSTIGELTAATGDRGEPWRRDGGERRGARLRTRERRARELLQRPPPQPPGAMPDRPFAQNPSWETLSAMEMGGWISDGPEAIPALQGTPELEGEVAFLDTSLSYDAFHLPLLKADRAL